MRTSLIPRRSSTRLTRATYRISMADPLSLGLDDEGDKDDDPFFNDDINQREYE